MNKKIVIVMGILVTVSPAFGADERQPSQAELRQTMLDAIARRTAPTNRRPTPPPVAPKPNRRQVTTRTAPPLVAYRRRRPEAAFEHGIDFRDISRAIAQHEQSLREEHDEVIASFIAQRLAALKVAALESRANVRKKMYKMHLSKLQREADQHSHGAAMDLEARFLGEIGHGLTAGDEDAARRLQAELNVGTSDTAEEDDELARALAMSLGQDPDAHGAPRLSGWAREEEERLSQNTLAKMREEDAARQRFAQEQREADERATAEAIRRMQEEDARRAQQTANEADEEATRLLIERMQRGDI
jgi:hypothetical protein